MKTHAAAAGTPMTDDWQRALAAERTRWPRDAARPLAPDEVAALLGRPEQPAEGSTEARSEALSVAGLLDRSARLRAQVDAQLRGLARRAGPRIKKSASDELIDRVDAQLRGVARCA